MKAWSTFSGVGGLDLGLEWAGAISEVSLFCEWEQWNRDLLALRYPDAELHKDIRTLEAINAPRPDIITGGFPCQDLSLAGKRAGMDGEKTGLWWHLTRQLAEQRPRWFVGENVSAILSDTQPVTVPDWVTWLGDRPARPLHGAMGAVLWSLAALGYDATWDGVPAGALGAPHRRDRWFLVAHSQGERHRTGSLSFRNGAAHSNAAGGCLANAASPRCEGHDAEQGSGRPQLPQPPPAGVWCRAIERARQQAPWTYLGGVGGASDGVSARVDRSWPTVRAVEWKRAGYQKGGDCANYETLGGACGAEPMPMPPKPRPVQPWEGREPRVKLHGPNWRPRLRALGNAVVPLAAMVPGLVLLEWKAANDRSNA